MTENPKTPTADGRGFSLRLGCWLDSLAQAVVPMASSGAVTVSAYLLIAGPIMIGILALTPPMQVPDAFVQFDRAAGIAHGQLVGEVFHGSAGGQLPVGVGRFDNYFEAIPFHPGRKVSFGSMAGAANVDWGQRAQFVPFPATTEYAPPLYLPGALVVWLAGLLSSKVVVAYYAVSLVNGLAFLALMSVSMSLLRSAYRWLVFAVGILPMSLSLAASPSTDGYVIGLSCILVAIVYRQIHQHPEADRVAAGSGSVPPGWSLWPPSLAELLAVLALLLICFAKPPYLVLAMGLAVPDMVGRRYRDAIARTGSRAVAVAIPVGAWYMLGARLQGIKAVELGGVSAGRQLAFSLHHPGVVVSAVATTLSGDAASYLHGFVGNLGWLDAPLATGVADVLLVGLTLVVCLLILASRLSGPVVGWSAACAALGVAGVIFAIYIESTPVGNSAVLGLQGRYFLPLVPLAILATIPERDSAPLRSYVTLGAGLLALAMGLVGWGGTVADLLYRYWVR